MFRFVLLDIESDQEVEIYAVAIQGKRWFLKQILTTCGIAAGQDKVYEWDIPDVLDKKIWGNVQQYNDSYINREGITVDTTKWKIAQVRAEKPEEITTEELSF